MVIALIARETFRIPVLDPTPDGRPRITQIDCYDQTKIRVSFGICNSGYTPIPPGTPVTFYDGDPTNAGARKIGASFLLPDTIYGFCCSAIYTEIVDVSKPKLNSLYLVFNDRGNEIPIKLPNTSFIERNYDNNIISKTGFGYNVTIDPPEVVLEPGDTIQLTATALPNSASSEYRWSPTDDLSCSDCPNPILTADSNTQKQVISKSEYGCTDTAIVDIKVPPVNDYTISLDQVQCMAKEDSLVVNFTVKNSYKRPVLPKGLAVAFYNVNPVNAEAALLYSVFKLPATLNQAQASFASGMKGVKEGELFAVVNDNGTTIPLKLPNTDLLETNYSNNTGSIIHEKITVTVSNSSPVCENDSVQLMAMSSVDGANFDWSGPGGFKSSSQNAWLTNITASNAGIYSAIASKNGCASDSAATSVVVNAAPVVIASAKEPVCETKSLALTASSANAASYSWTGPGGFTSTDQNPVIAPVTFAASGTYHVTATGNNKCISQAVPVQVKVNPLPVPAFTAPEICLPSTTVQFKNESTISQGSIDSWLWNFGDPLSGGSNIDSVRHPVHKFSNAGKYSVTLKAVSSEGCMASTSLLYAGIHKQPEASFTNDHPNGVLRK
jgi:PKD repeat protein